MAHVIALTSLAALGLSDAPFHEPFYADGTQRAHDHTERSGWNPPKWRGPLPCSSLVRPPSADHICEGTWLFTAAAGCWRLPALPSGIPHRSHCEVLPATGLRAQAQDGRGLGTFRVRAACVIAGIWSSRMPMDRGPAGVPTDRPSDRMLAGNACSSVSMARASRRAAAGTAGCR